MALRSGYGPEHPELSLFLLAEIGDDSNGLALTVQSAFARLDHDPYAEAERLRGLPRAMALAAMTDLIEALPAGSWTERNSREIAADLLARLPQGRGTAKAMPTTNPERRPAYGLTTTRILVCAGFIALAAFAIWGMKEDRTDYMDLSDAPLVAPSLTRSGMPMPMRVKPRPSHAAKEQPSHAAG